MSWRFREGEVLKNLGSTYRDLGYVEQARHYLEQALRILEETKSPTTATVRKWLEALKES